MPKHFPTDLALVILFTLLCTPFVLVSPLNETPIKTFRKSFIKKNILGLPLVLFLPGYSLIAVLFPRKDDLEGIERIALSFGLSIAVVPLLGLALNYTPFGIRLTPILGVLSIFTISLALGAYVRRSMIPEEDRFAVDNFFGKKISKTSDIRFAQSDYRTLFDNIKESFKATGTKIDKILTIILIISIILAISMTVYMIVTPKEGEKFTEFYVLGPGGKAADYPTNLKVGEMGEVIIGVVNHEYANVTYQLEVKLNGDVIGERMIELMHNETWESPFTFRVERAGEDQKLEFLLFKNPFEKSVYGKEDKEEVYRSLHLWVDIT